MVKTYRPAHELLAAMLRIANNGAARTRIQNGSGLNMSQAAFYIDGMIEQGLIKPEKQDDGTIYYFTSDKGKKALKAAEDLEKLFVYKEASGGKKT